MKKAPCVPLNDVNALPLIDELGVFGDAGGNDGEFCIHMCSSNVMPVPDAESGVSLVGEPISCPALDEFRPSTPPLGPCPVK